MGWIPLLCDSWERGFLHLRGGGGHFLTCFKNIHLYLNVWSSIAFLFLQSCSCCIKAYTQHKPDFTQESTTDFNTVCDLFTTNTTCIHYFDFKSKLCYWKCFFIVILLFFYSNTIFINMFKCNKYKKRNIFSLLIFHRFCICILNYTLHFVFCVTGLQGIMDSILENYYVIPFPFF